MATKDAAVRLSAPTPEYTTASEVLYEQIVEAARIHGEESEPDHEVGDLQEALYAALALMTNEQRGHLSRGLKEQLRLDDHD